MSCHLKFGAATAALPRKRLAEKPPLLPSDDEDNAVTDTVFTHCLAETDRERGFIQFNWHGLE